MNRSLKIAVLLFSLVAVVGSARAACECTNCTCASTSNQDTQRQVDQLVHDLQKLAAVVAAVQAALGDVQQEVQEIVPCTCNE